MAFGLSPRLPSVPQRHCGGRFSVATMKAAALLYTLVLCLLGPTAQAADRPVYTFGVISQRTPVLTAQYWNPILVKVTELSGVQLELRVARTGPDHAAAVRDGALDFIYSNHNFLPGNDGAGYRVIARPAQLAVTGQIVVRADSPLKSLADLRGREVVFPSRSAFLGYHVPMDALLRAGVPIEVRFAGNQEGAIAQLKSGAATAIGVNSQIMSEFAAREAVRYRVVWTSEAYHNLPILALPGLPARDVEAVRAAFVNLAQAPGGMQVLEASAALVQQQPPYGFVAASDDDYDNVRRFYRATRLRLDPP
jgi:phosphonate transport system substrate-binding protein